MVHQGVAKITDFGNSKSMNTVTRIHDSLFGAIPYVAPEILKAGKVNEIEQHPYTKSSDIYSLEFYYEKYQVVKILFEDYGNYGIIATALPGKEF